MARIWQATTSHSEDDPQICGLHDTTGCIGEIDGLGSVPGGIRGTDQGRDDAHDCFYLTCRGTDAAPAAQIQSSRKADDYDTGYRQTPSGKYREVGSCRKGHQSSADCSAAKCVVGNWRNKKLWKWQEYRCASAGGVHSPVDCENAGHSGGGWRDVLVWEKAVHAQCASDAGYVVPGRRVTAFRGARTLGYAHQVAQTPESPLMDLGRALDFGDEDED